MSHLFLFNQLVTGVFTLCLPSEEPGIATVPASDANVTFALNLPLKEEVNHMGRAAIPLAYGHNGRGSV
ncbi:hypothetical protein [Dryocola sp. BD613]|uniref:hypothetical protein n=1 Tax=Dryocola sp. BD613 TaxID=3133272 RepID=UPI003F500468